MPKHDSLRELSERLGRIDERNPLSVRELEDVDAASRILALLAGVKVEAIRDNPSEVGGAFLNLLSECHAIARD